MRRRDKDQEFGEYVAARRPTLYRTAYFLCGDPHQAEDLVQTALAKVYVAWRRLRDDGNVDAYVRRTLANAQIDHARRSWRRELVGVALPERSAPEPAIAFDESDALVCALRSLAPGQRRVVVLRHYWGLSVDETAADLGISPGTVKSQTSDALARLRELLTPAATTKEKP